MAGTIKYWKQKVLTVKKEVTYGTDPTPTGALNAVLVSDLSLSIDSDEVATPVDGATYQNDIIDFTNKTVTISGSINMYGSGTAGTAPDYAPLMVGCQMDETINAATDVTYKPVSGSTESVTFYIEIDGIRYIVNGSKGNASFSAKIKEFTVFSFEFQGLYLEPTDAVITGATYANRAATLGSNDMSELSVHGTLIDGIGFTLDSGNTNNAKESTETYAVVNEDRKSTASIECWADTIANFNPFAINAAKTKGVVYWRHGVTAGDIIEFNLPKAMLKIPQPTEIDGISGYNIDLVPYPDTAGDDEFAIVIK